MCFIIWCNDFRPNVPNVQDQFLAKTAAAPELLRSNAERLKHLGVPAEIEEHCKRLIDTVGRGGGFILNGEPPKEVTPENIRAMIHTARTYGRYES